MVSCFPRQCVPNIRKHFFVFVIFNGNKMLKQLSFSTDVTWGVWIWLNKWSHYYAAYEWEREIIQMVTVISVIICILAQNSIVGIVCFGMLSLSTSHNAHILGQYIARRPSFIAILSQCAFNYLWKWLKHCPLVIRLTKAGVDRVLDDPT